MIRYPFGSAFSYSGSFFLLFGLFVSHVVHDHVPPETPSHFFLISLALGRYYGLDIDGECLVCRSIRAICWNDIWFPGRLWFCWVSWKIRAGLWYMSGGQAVSFLQLARFSARVYWFAFGVWRLAMWKPQSFWLLVKFCRPRGPRHHSHYCHHG